MLADGHLGCFCPRGRCERGYSPPKVLGPLLQTPHVAYKADPRLSPPGWLWGTPPSQRPRDRPSACSPCVQVDLGAQYIKSAVKNVPSVFLMTDSQVAEEQFLVLINDLLASGEIPGLFTDDELENIISSMRPQVKSLGMNDTRETCWKFFIDKVRRQLKVGARVFAASRGARRGAQVLSSVRSRVGGGGAAPPSHEEGPSERTVGLRGGREPTEVSRGQEKRFLPPTHTQV